MAADLSQMSTPSSGWRVLDLPVREMWRPCARAGAAVVDHPLTCHTAHTAQEEAAQSHGGSLLSTRNSNVLDARPAGQLGLLARDDKERVTRDLSAALARSVATISRGGSPVKSRPREASPRKEHASLHGGGSTNASTLAAGAREGTDAESVNAAHHDPEMERSESVVRSLQEQAKRRLNGLERLHAGAESKASGPTLYNPAAYQVSLSAMQPAAAQVGNARKHILLRGSLASGGHGPMSSLPCLG